MNFEKSYSNYINDQRQALWHLYSELSLRLMHVLTSKEPEVTSELTFITNQLAIFGLEMFNQYNLINTIEVKIELIARHYGLDSSKFETFEENKKKAKLLISNEENKRIWLTIVPSFISGKIKMMITRHNSYNRVYTVDSIILPLDDSIEKYIKAIEEYIE